MDAHRGDEVTIYCLVCKKPVKASSRLAHLRTDLRVFSEDHSGQVDPRRDQGWFEVGPDCYRKIVKAGREGFYLA